MLILNSFIQGLVVFLASFGPVSGGVGQFLGPLSGSLIGSLENLAVTGALGFVELPLDQIAEIIRALALGGV
jgi:hypothetical protein